MDAVASIATCDEAERGNEEEEDEQGIRKTTLAYMMRENGKCILGSNPDSRISSSSVRRLVETEQDGSEMKGIVLCV